jgi:hypothetical protein
MTCTSPQPEQVRAMRLIALLSSRSAAKCRMPHARTAQAALSTILRNLQAAEDGQPVAWLVVEQLYRQLEFCALNGRWEQMPPGDYGLIGNAFKLEFFCRGGKNDLQCCTCLAQNKDTDDE